ncbi:2TM domain-containing protein [Winogradskyella bathintestinalis]|uniref:2TM domain-containing protein n=1 Tax=Winogradskyella bathintestinalis TaxID=3035208 RepID=A0ABT7ZWM6_9FLAO|nr:2TM domain-containing protein [Winogradskyella bathintestinalis]MDN3493393.1 2TM domain-containing protein [Winogradskyella bathintestinalis]
MTSGENQRLERAKKRVKRLKLFYIHLAGYIVFVALLLYNLYIVAGPYKNNIISLNLSIIVVWTVLIFVHGLHIFKGKRIFKKSWEDRKVERFLKEKKEEETTFWE